MLCPIINLEQGHPTAQFACSRLSQELRIAKANRVAALKIIHGYGSSGQGGAIKTKVQLLLQQRKQQGLIRAFVKGEDFSPFTPQGRQVLSLCPQLSKDMDCSRRNDGITMVVL